MDGFSHLITLLLALGSTSTSITLSSSISTGIISTGLVATGIMPTGLVLTGSMISSGSLASVIDARYDSSRVQQEWLGRVNTERGVMKRTPYQLDNRLNTTAQAWADFLRDTDQINNKLMHDRTPEIISNKDGTWNYSYTEMKDRFAGHGVRFTSKGTAFTEIVGRGYVSCKSDLSREQCTQRVIDTTKTTMDLFMKEKKGNGPHYKALVNSSFDRIGVGVAIDWKKNDSNKNRYRFVGHVSGPIAE